MGVQHAQLLLFLLFLLLLLLLFLLLFLLFFAPVALPAALSELPASLGVGVRMKSKFDQALFLKRLHLSFQ
jgi:hypothetical protein